VDDAPQPVDLPLKVLVVEAHNLLICGSQVLSEALQLCEEWLELLIKALSRDLVTVDLTPWLVVDLDIRNP
jgi:hypothetical protein